MLTTCLICKQTRLTPLRYPYTSVENPFHIKQILQCPNCGFAQADPMPSEKVLNDFYEKGEYWHDSLSSMVPYAISQLFE